MRAWMSQTDLPESPLRGIRGRPARLGLRAMLAMLAVGGPSRASPDEVTHGYLFEVGPVYGEFAPASRIFSFTLPLFDPAAGRLDNVTLFVDGMLDVEVVSFGLCDTPEPLCRTHAYDFSTYGSVEIWAGDNVGHLFDTSATVWRDAAVAEGSFSPQRAELVTHYVMGIDLPRDGAPETGGFAEYVPECHPIPTPPYEMCWDRSSCEGCEWKASRSDSLPGYLFYADLERFIATQPGQTVPLHISSKAIFQSNTATAYGRHVIESRGTLIISYKFTPSLSPIANAGPDDTVHVGSTVTLDGSASADPNVPAQTPLTYAWALGAPAGSGAALNDPTAVNPAFTADVMGTYIATLTVTNALGLQSTQDSVTISTSNSAPLASAGPDQAILLDKSTVQLDGSQSWDPDGDPLTYSWTFTSVPFGATAPTLSSSSAVTPTFVIDVHGTYVVQLTVSDGWTASAPSYVTLGFDNLPPVANAGVGGSVLVGTPIVLDGTASADPNLDPLTYAWSLVSAPELSHATIAQSAETVASLVPDLPGTYVAQLVVNDGLVPSSPSTVSWFVYTTPDKIKRDAEYIQWVIRGLPPGALRSGGQVKALIAKLNTFIQDIDKQDYAAALGKLEDDVLLRVDGCAISSPPTPNGDDFIRNCADQATVYPLVLDLIAQVMALM